jgi:hypothetical protein
MASLKMKQIKIKPYKETKIITICESVGKYTGSICGLIFYYSIFLIIMLFIGFYNFIMGIVEKLSKKGDERGKKEN